VNKSDAAAQLGFIWMIEARPNAQCPFWHCRRTSGRVAGYHLHIACDHVMKVMAGRGDKLFVWYGRPLKGEAKPV
jgi:hypothetical protein